MEFLTILLPIFFFSCRQVFGLCRLPHEGELALVLEYAPGGDLLDLSKKGCPPFKRVCEILEGAALGVAFMHSKGYVHCDLKSANVLICAGGVPKIADFGLVHRLRDGALKNTLGRRSSTVAAERGTSGFLAPENYEDSSENPDAGKRPGDVYSLAMIAVEMLTQDEPWPGKTSLQIMKSVTAGRRPALPAGVDPRLAALIEACWAQSPAARPTAAEMAGRLRAMRT